MQLFVDRLTNIDFSYLDPVRGLVGETWLANVVLDGKLDKQGMVHDFGLVKKTLRDWLDKTVDHCLLVPSAAVKACDDQVCIVDWCYGDNEWIYCQSPAQAITIIETEIITPETVAAWCIEQFRTILPKTIDAIELNFSTEETVGHYYHYSHGLRKHDGNCQRIAHGHRSTIEIYLDQQRIDALEQQWVRRWQDIYIATEEDIHAIFYHCRKPYYHFMYTAQQGDFELKIPVNRCELIQTESTVEHIAYYIARQLHNRYSAQSLRVKAFEGYKKGAIAII